MDEQAYFLVLDAIYNSAIAPENWILALRRLGEFFDCTVANLVDRNLRTLNGNVVSSGTDLADQREYLSVWTSRNVFLDKPHRYSTGMIVTDQQIMPKPKLLASDFYNGYLLPRDLHSLLRFSLSIEDDVHQSISLLRPKHFGEFEQSDIERSRVFLPHLQRAAKVTRHIGVSAVMMQTMNSVLEVHKDGIIMLDRRGKVVFANRTARSMSEARDGFLVARGQIEARNSDNNKELQVLIAGALGQIKILDAPRGGVMKLNGRSAGRGYIAVVTSVSRAEAVHDQAVPAVCVVITDLDDMPANQRSIMQKLFGLTAAEAQLAERIMLGDTPEQAATFMKIKITTARTHLTQVFRKTETSRQTELVGLLLRLPSRLD